VQSYLPRYVKELQLKGSFTGTDFDFLIFPVAIQALQDILLRRHVWNHQLETRIIRPSPVLHIEDVFAVSKLTMKKGDIGINRY